MVAIDRAGIKTYHMRHEQSGVYMADGWARATGRPGVAMGAQLGRPGKQVVNLLGDAGMGVAGWDIETAARYKIPACYFLFNNSSWMGDAAQQIVLPLDVKNRNRGTLPDIRYDKTFAEMGCYTELVTEPQQIKPALERAFNSGKTSVINVIPDKTVLAPQLAGRIEYYRKLFG